MDFRVHSVSFFLPLLRLPVQIHLSPLELENFRLRFPLGRKVWSDGVTEEEVSHQSKPNKVVVSLETRTHLSGTIPLVNS